MENENKTTEQQLEQNRKELFDHYQRCRAQFPICPLRSAAVIERQSEVCK
ncbi:MAG: hypothetical protein AAFY09_12780 [Pseudomonadota bacterium]